MKYRVAIVAEIESKLDLHTLGTRLIVASSVDNVNDIDSLTYETFEIEEIDYPEVDLTKL